MAEEGNIATDVAKQDAGIPRVLSTSRVLPAQTPEARAVLIGVPLLSATPNNIDRHTLEVIPEETARKYRLVVYGRSKDTLLVAMLDPQDVEALNVLRFIAEKEHIGIDIALTTEKVFAEILGNYTGTDEALKDAILSLKNDDDEQLTIDEKSPKPKSGESEVYQDAPISKLVEVIVHHAIDGRASDIHIEPMTDEYRVRFRVDGILRSSLVFPMEVGRAVISRVKILSNLKIDEKRQPQDGRFRFEDSAGSFVDFRVSSFPVLEGEKIVMRLLTKDANLTDLDKLGLWGRNREVLLRKLKEPFGMILITGPTGSGKSTTLYSFLQILNNEGRNIVTLEDPVEYYLDGINQSQIRPEIGYTFASGLRSILRQDPNVIMVGEMRDNETAELGVHAALTGHIVLSTLHTNDAIGAIPRFIDMNVEPFLLASSIQAVAAQRLVRKICDRCKEEVSATDAMRKEIVNELAKISDKEKVAYHFDVTKPFRLFHGKGCDACAQSGFRGRLAVYEVFEANDTVRTIISDKHGDPIELLAEADKQGMLSMFQDGLLKALQGITTLAEVKREAKGDIMVDEE